MQIHLQKPRLGIITGMTGEMGVVTHSLNLIVLLSPALLKIQMLLLVSKLMPRVIVIVMAIVCLSAILQLPLCFPLGPIISIQILIVTLIIIVIISVTVTVTFLSIITNTVVT